jgi:hypothetical protein
MRRQSADKNFPRLLSSACLIALTVKKNSSDQIDRLNVNEHNRAWSRITRQSMLMSHLTAVFCSRRQNRTCQPINWRSLFYHWKSSWVSSNNDMHRVRCQVISTEQQSLNENHQRPLETEEARLLSIGQQLLAKNQQHSLGLEDLMAALKTDMDNVASSLQRFGIPSYSLANTGVLGVFTILLYTLRHVTMCAFFAESTACCVPRQGDN